MKQKRLVLRGSEILKRSDEPNAHQFSLKARITAQTAYKYLNAPEGMESVDTKILAAILLDGLGLTPAQLLTVKLGEIFDLVDDE